MSPNGATRESSGRFSARLLTALDSTTSPLDLAQYAAAIALKTLGDGCALWLWERRSGELRLVAARHREPEKDPLLQQLMRSWLTPRHGEAWYQVAELGRPAVWCTEQEGQAVELLGSRRQAGIARRIGVRSVLVAPLCRGRRKIGIMAIVSADAATFADKRNLAEAADMARQLGAALAVSQKLDMARQTGRQLTMTSLRLQTVLESIPQGVVVAGPGEGKIAFANRSLNRLLGLPADSPALPFNGADLSWLLKPSGERYEQEEVPWIRTARTGKPAPAEEMLVRRSDGSSVAVLCSASPIRDERGDSAGAVAILQDISDLKQFERHKDEFLAMVAHELRTPLTALKGYLQLVHRLLEKEPGAESRDRGLEMIQVADQQVNRLARMIRDLLDFSRIRAGRLDLLPAAFSLGELARRVVVQMQIASPHHKLDSRVSGDTTVRADPDRIEQVLVNLLSNAVNATQPGGRIWTEVRPEGGQVVVSVQDEGSGMTRETRERLFEQLYRGAASRYRGMGLGLYISKAIIDTHGGRIWFESEVGKGTTFHFSLPRVEDRGAEPKGDVARERGQDASAPGGL